MYSNTTPERLASADTDSVARQDLHVRDHEHRVGR
jgi:hypothetical protein